MSKRQWTKHDEEILLSLVDRKTVTELASIFGRPNSAISSKIWQLTRKGKESEPASAPAPESIEVDYADALALQNMGIREGHRIDFQMAGLRFYVA